MFFVLHKKKTMQWHLYLMHWFFFLAVLGDCVVPRKWREILKRKMHDAMRKLRGKCLKWDESTVGRELRENFKCFIVRHAKIILSLVNVLLSKTCVKVSKVQPTKIWAQILPKTQINVAARQFIFIPKHFIIINALYTVNSWVVSSLWQK